MEGNNQSKSKISRQQQQPKKQRRQSCVGNVIKKSCMHVTKSRNNDITQVRKNKSLRLSENQQTLCALLDLLFNGLLIFVSAISQQGKLNVKEDVANLDVKKKWMKNFSLYFFVGIFRIRGNLLSMRVTIFLMMVFGFLIFQFYSGSIVSSLLKPKPNSIKTLRDLLDSQLMLGIDDVAYNRDYFNVRISSMPFLFCLSIFLTKKNSV